MLRKLLSLGALVVVALALGAGPAAAKLNDGNGPGSVSSAWDNSNGKKFTSDGFSDGRLGN
jgi:hypothetical protein